MFGRAGSSTASTLSTAIGDSSDEYCDTTLLLNDLRHDRPSASCVVSAQPPALRSVGTPSPGTERQGAAEAYVLEASSREALSSSLTGIEIESSTYKSAACLMSLHTRVRMAKSAWTGAAPSLPARLLD